MTARVLALATLLVASGCAASPTAPSNQAPLGLTANVNATQLSPGATAVATFRLRNTGTSSVTLNFNSSCQVMPFIARHPSSEIVYPAGGGWGCATVLTQLTLAPGETHDVEVRVIAGETRPGFVTLPPGDYAFFARVESREHTLESARVMLQVR
jgi:hypothetical protein